MNRLLSLLGRASTLPLLFGVLSGCGGAGGGPLQPEGPLDDYPYPTGRIVLSHLPVDPERVVNFWGIGNLNVLPEDHGGFYTPLEGHYKEPTIPVYAPANGKIFSIGQRWLPSFAPSVQRLLHTPRNSVRPD